MPITALSLCRSCRRSRQAKPHGDPDPGLIAGHEHGADCGAEKMQP